MSWLFARLEIGSKTTHDVVTIDTYHLRYTSGLAAGYAPTSMLRIPLGGPSVPASLARIDPRAEPDLQLHLGS